MGCRTGSRLRPGFEGGQTPLYRRLPKLKGIGGGMSAGLSKYLVVNLDDCERAFKPNENVDLETLESKGILNRSGRDRKLALKILGRGSLSKPLTIKAASFSTSARKAIETSMGKAYVIPQKAKWTRRDCKRKISVSVD